MNEGIDPGDSSRINKGVQENLDDENSNLNYLRNHGPLLEIKKLDWQDRQKIQMRVYKICKQKLAYCHDQLEPKKKTKRTELDMQSYEVTAGWMKALQRVIETKDKILSKRYKNICY